MDRGWRPFAQCSAVARRLRLHALIICRCYPFPLRQRGQVPGAPACAAGDGNADRSWESALPRTRATTAAQGGRQVSPAVSLQLFCLPYSGPAPRCSAAGSPACRAGSACYPWNCRGAAFASARPLHTDAASLVAQLAGELQGTLDSASPYAFGHSLGGLLAFELAHAMRRRGSKGRWRYSSPAYPRPPKTMSAATGAPRPTPNWSPRCATTGVLRRPSSTIRR